MQEVDKTTGDDGSISIRQSMLFGGNGSTTSKLNFLRTLTAPDLGQDHLNNEGI